MWSVVWEIIKSLDGFIAIIVSAILYVKKSAKKDFDQELLEKRVKTLEDTIKSFSIVEKEVENMRSNIHRLNNSVNQLQSTLLVNSKEEQEKYHILEKKINLLLFGLQTIFKKEGLDLNDYTEFN